MHTRLVAEYGYWLDGRGVDWSWFDEFSGTVDRRYSHLREFGSSGAASAADVLASEARRRFGELGSYVDAVPHGLCTRMIAAAVGGWRELSGESSDSAFDWG